MKMMPGMNPKQMKQMMKQMGMKTEDIDAQEVIIKTSDKVYRFDVPQVQKIAMQGQTTFQIVGEYSIEDLELEVKISDEDVKVVMKEADVDEDKAKQALEETKGDIAEAIVKLTE